MNIIASENFRFLSLDSLARLTPSIFTEDSAARTSEKYRHISTIKLVESLMGEGFLPTFAGQSNARTEAKKFHAKHCLRFRHRDAISTIDGLYPEIVLINSHDGLSSYRLISGLYRLVCSNGLVAGNAYDEVRVRHKGDIVGDVIEGTYKIIEESKGLIEVASEMSSIELNNSEKLFLAESAHSIRFDGELKGEEFEARKFLTPRRTQDMNKNDLFTVFNVIQENMIKGGIRGYTRNSRGFLRRISTRAVRCIDKNTTLNKGV